MSAPPFFTALGTGANPTWQKSVNSGGSYSAGAAYATSQTVGPTGTERVRTTFTIDPGYSGSMQITAGGDIFDNGLNRAAILFYDGIKLGFVINPTTATPNSLFGPKVFNLPVVPGVHTLELWIGEGTAGGVTSPTVTGNFSQATLASPCNCCPLGISRCYLNENDYSIGTVSLVGCGSTRQWIDSFSGAVIAAPKFCIQTPSDLTLNGEMLLPGAVGQQQAYSALSTPPSSTDMVQTSPGVYQSASAVVAACFGARVANMTWTQRMNFIQLDQGANPAIGGSVSGALASKFTSLATGPIGFNPFTNVRLQVGQSVISPVLSDGSYARLTYVKNSTGAPIPGTLNEPYNTSSCGFTQNIYVHDSSVNADRFTIRLDFFKP